VEGRGVYKTLRTARGLPQIALSVGEFVTQFAGYATLEGFRVVKLLVRIFSCVYKSRGGRGKTERGQEVSTCLEDDGVADMHGRSGVAQINGFSWVSGVQQQFSDNHPPMCRTEFSKGSSTSTSMLIA
jgi:hypothetical protein